MDITAAINNVPTLQVLGLDKHGEQKAPCKAARYAAKKAARKATRKATSNGQDRFVKVMKIVGLCLCYIPIAKLGDSGKPGRSMMAGVLTTFLTDAILEKMKQIKATW
ncbi:MAG: hypothetical protein F4W90_06735 [Gammaproteobacteria bacterium]|nr:hypothetical protein [Gammaproteobacteria bacterium]